MFKGGIHYGSVCLAIYVEDMLIKEINRFVIPNPQPLVQSRRVIPVSFVFVIVGKV